MDNTHLNRRHRCWARWALWIIIGLAITSLILASIGLARKMLEPKVQIWAGDVVLHARLADTDSERYDGLSGVERLGRDQALLFEFDTSSDWGIVMRGMKIPIDIIWLDGKKQVVHIERNVQPDAEPYIVYKPPTPARYVIETAAGTSDRAKIKLGETIKFDIKAADR